MKAITLYGPECRTRLRYTLPIPHVLVAKRSDLRLTTGNDEIPRAPPTWLRVLQLSSTGISIGFRIHQNILSVAAKAFLLSALPLNTYSTTRDPSGARQQCVSRQDTSRVTGQWVSRHECPREKAVYAG